MSRTNPKNQTETYSDDAARGITTIQGLDGVKLITTSYVNAGLLNGKVRNVIQIKNGVSTELQRCDYDEKGNLIRNYVLMAKPHLFSYKYNDLGKQTEIGVDNKEWITKQYDDRGRLIEKDLANGIKMTYTYIGDRITKTTFIKSGKPIVKVLDNKFHLIEETIQPNQSIQEKDPIK